ncbi:hypothetical protein [Paraburkholderia xenovorans]|uniref:hypothetical protein n=1 Tax=Paraburkholderia xenovorans TaxID=36873 RepID=UPI0038B89B45
MVRASGAWPLRDRVVGKAKISFRTEVRAAAIDNDQVILRVISENKESPVVAAQCRLAYSQFAESGRNHRGTGFIETHRAERPDE